MSMNIGLLVGYTSLARDEIYNEAGGITVSKKACRQYSHSVPNASSSKPGKM
jgi:hypothetical protein